MKDGRMSTALIQDVVDKRQRHTKSGFFAGVIQPLRASKTTERDEMRATLRAWLESVREKTGLSWEKIGKQSGVDPSNLTRFMKPEARTGLGLETIRRITQTFGIPVPENVGIEAPQRAFREPELKPWRHQTMAATRVNSNNIDWWTIRTNLLDLDGIIPGDKVAIDLSRAAEPGDIVVAQAQRGHEVETIIRKYEPPFLTCHTTARAYPRPEMVDGDRIVIMGTVVALQRDFGDAA